MSDNIDHVIEADLSEGSPNTLKMDPANKIEASICDEKHGKYLCFTVLVYFIATKKLPPILNLGLKFDLCFR